MREADAIAFVRHWHEGQVDKSGRPYHEHVEAVAEIIRGRSGALPPDERHAVILAALGHDLLEDTPVTAAYLLEAGWPIRSVEIIERLTGRPEGVSYLDNIRAMVAEGDFAVMMVKLADNEHNSCPERIASLPESERSIVKRYARSMELLCDALEKGDEASG